MFGGHAYVALTGPADLEVSHLHVTFKEPVDNRNAEK